MFITYLTGALYMHPLWFYKHQHDNRFRSKLFVGCQRWRFQWRFWFVPSVPVYLREEEEHKPDPWRNLIERNHLGLHLENEVAVVKTPIIISNNPLLEYYEGTIPQVAGHCTSRIAVTDISLTDNIQGNIRRRGKTTSEDRTCLYWLTPLCCC